MFHFLRNCQPVFQSDYTILISHWQGTGSSCFSTSLSTFGIDSVLDFGHPNRCIVVSHFNLHFPVVYGLDSFHMHSCYVYIFFGDMFYKVFGPFLFGLFLLTLVRFLVFFVGGILKEIAYSLEPNEMNRKQIISTDNLSED